MELFLPVILGTAREGRRSEVAARYVLGETAKRAGVTTELIDVRDHLKSYTKRQKDGAGQDALGALITRADGYIIVSPEYNHGYPGELKIFLDTFYAEFAKKPVGLIGVSNGPIGGARMVQTLRLTSVALGMVPLQKTMYFHNMPKPFDEQGNLLEPATAEKLVGLLDDLEWYGRALKTARQSST